MANISCIYKITSIINGKCYIGSASYWDKRRAEHISSLKKGEHNQKLQNHVNKYGLDDLKFEVLEIVERKKKILLEREQFYIDQYNCVKNGFNVCEIAGSCMGVKASDETKQKQRLAKLGTKQSPEVIAKRVVKLIGQKRNFPEGWVPPNKGKKASPELIEKLRISHLGISPSNKGKPQSEEQKKAHSLRMTGRKASDETKRKLSEMKKGKPSPLRGRKMSEETKKKISDAVSGEKNGFFGKTHSDETKIKLSLASKGRKLTDEQKEKIRLRGLGRKQSDEAKLKISKANSGRIYSEESKQKMRDAWVRRKNRELSM